MQKLHSHVHERSYFGEFDASPVLDWLNSKKRPAGDPVEELIKLNAELPIGATEHDVRAFLGEIVRRSKLAVAPILSNAMPGRW